MTPLPTPMKEDPTHEIALTQPFRTSSGFTCLTTGWHDAVLTPDGYRLWQYGDLVPNDQIKEVKPV